MAADNKLLGQFNLEGIPSAARGVPQIEVTFDIDANGIVKVSAKDKATGKEQAISIKASGGLDDSEIEQMVQDAETYAEQDKERREKVEIRNQSEALLHGAQKSIDDLGDKADPAMKSDVEAAIAELTTALEGEDEQQISEKSEALSAVLMKLGEAAYQGDQNMAGAQADDTNTDQDNDDVVDADFEEVDDDKDAKEGLNLSLDNFGK